MCWGLYLAIPLEVELPPVPGELSEADDSFLAWPEPNPWIAAALGDQFCCWILGHGRHCSCGCIETSIDQKVMLSRVARTYIADIAESPATIRFAVHWTRGSFATEELVLDLATSITASELRWNDFRTFPSDTVIWVGLR